MKKYLIALCAVLLTWVSCTKDDDLLFDKSPDVRISEALATYNQLLTSAPNGWIGHLFPGEGTVGGFNYLMKFDDKGNVSMTADISINQDESLDNPIVSTYRVRAALGPTLVFDSYTYIHELSDPDLFGSANAYVSDFEFIFLSASANQDTIHLQGTLNKSSFTLVKAKADETAQLKANMDNFSVLDSVLVKKYTSRKTIDIDGKKYFLSYSNNLDRTMTFTAQDGGEVFTATFYFTSEGIQFFKPLQLGNSSVAGIKKLVFDKSKNMIKLELMSGKATEIQAIEVPFVVNIEAAKEFADLSKMATAQGGFTVEGIPDYHGLGANGEVSAIQLYLNYFDLGFETKSSGILIYPGWTGYYIQNNIDQLDKGIIAFDYLGRRGTIPTSFASALLENTLILIDKAGFYVVPTGKSKYDLVSVDFTKWISLR